MKLYRTVNGQVVTRNAGPKDAAKMKARGWSDEAPKPVKKTKAKANADKA